MKCPHCPVGPGYHCPSEDDPSLCPRVREELASLAAEPPSLPELARSLLAAIRGLIADGGRLAPRDIRKARRAACLACPRHDAERDACSSCGCGSVVAGGLAAKRAIASSVCPEARWEAV